MIKINKKIIGLIIGTIITSTIFMGCGDSKKNKIDSNLPKTELNVAGELIPTTLDTAENWDGWYVVRYGVAETLVKLADDGTFQPWLAESWTSNDSATSWTFKLKDGIKFSNGELLTPQKVKESIERLYYINDPKNGGVGNPQGYFEYSSIEIDEENNTITINSEEPVVDMLGCVAYPWMAIIDVEATKNIDVKTEGVIGTGPYVFEDFVQDSSIEFSSNKNYWGGEVSFEKINYTYINDSRTRSMALIDGSADLTMNLSKSNRDTVLENEDNFVEIVAGSRVGMGHMNLKGVLKNKALREAINMAVDSETIAHITTGGNYEYGQAVLPMNYDFGGDELNLNEAYNPKKAKEILDKAGIVDSDGDGWREIDGENIVLDYKVYAVRSLDIIAQAGISLIKEIGIDVEMTVVNNITEILNNRTFDIATVSEVTMPTGDPQRYLSHWYSKSNDNYSGYVNNQYDIIYEKLLKEVDVVARKELIKQLQQIILDDVPCIVYGFYTTNMASTEAIEGVSASTSDFYWITNEIKPSK